MSKLLDKMTKERDDEVKSKEGKESKEIVIYSRGGFLPELKFAYEPIGDFYYIYNQNGQRGMAKANLDAKSKRYYLQIGEDPYYFEGKPLEKCFFDTPSQDDAKEWIEGRWPELTGQEIFTEIYNLFKVAIDFKAAHYYLIPVLAVLQSWIEPLLDSVFYAGFEAKFGGGKTKVLEALACLMRHGFLCQPSKAGLLRSMEGQGLNPCVDEIDALNGSQDNELVKALRMGYRRNNRIMIMNEKDYSKFETFDAFGTKAFTYKDDVEPAFKQRSLIGQLIPTADKRLPVINKYLSLYGKEVKIKLYFYHLDKIVQSSRNSGFLPSLPFLPLNQGGMDIEQARQEVYEQILKPFSAEDREFIETWSGRNIELAFNIIIIQSFYSINIIKEARDCFQEKEDEDRGSSETLQYLELKDVLVELYDTHHSDWSLDKGMFKGCFYYPKEYVYQKLQAKLREKGLYLVKPDAYRGLLKEFNFSLGEQGNIKRQYFEGKKNLLCLVYTEDVLRLLELKKGGLND